jgi:hypothetical protein
VKKYLSPDNCSILSTDPVETAARAVEVFSGVRATGLVASVNKTTRRFWRVTSSSTLSRHARTMALADEPGGSNVAHTYEELRKMKVDGLREIAAASEDPRLEGNSQMNKDHLLPLLCEVLGIQAHVHHEVIGIDKAAIKGQIKELKVERDQALADKDKDRLRQARRAIRKLKHKLHRATI